MWPRSDRSAAPASARRSGRRAARAAVLALVVLLPATAFAQLDQQDETDLTGRQNLTQGSGARAYGMGGAFLARPDDATAASWNPAGLSYLRLPELSVVGNLNRFAFETGGTSDVFRGGAFDFGAVTWPVAVREVSGAIQFSYQRAIPFDGTREIRSEAGPTDGRSDGGFDVLGFGMGLKLTRHVRAGFTLNRWFGGYTQELTRLVPLRANSVRELFLDFSIGGWNANLGLIVSPIEELNLAAVFKTPFEADVKLRKSRRDTWEEGEFGSTVTANAYRSDDVRLEFPSSLGFGVSWRPRDTLTLSADLTQTDWSESRITDYFSLGATPPGAAARDPDVYDELPYPTLSPRIEQEDAMQVRVGVEYVLIAGRLKVPFRAGYFSDRQIEPNASGETPRYNGLTVGTGVILGSLLLDVAYLREFGEVKTQRLFASLIYRYGGRP